MFWRFQGVPLPEDHGVAPVFLFLTPGLLVRIVIFCRIVILPRLSNRWSQILVGVVLSGWWIISPVFQSYSPPWPTEFDLVGETGFFGWTSCQVGLLQFLLHPPLPHSRVFVITHPIVPSWFLPGVVLPDRTVKAAGAIRSVEVSVFLVPDSMWDSCDHTRVWLGVGSLVGSGARFVVLVLWPGVLCHISGIAVQ